MVLFPDTVKKKQASHLLSTRVADQLAILHLVAGGLDDGDFRARPIGVRRGKRLADQIGLRQRQRTASRADAQELCRSRHGASFSA